MRVILSRKGFDSSNGGCASPIFPDNTMLSLPIPSEDGNMDYGELSYNGATYADLLRTLNPKVNYRKCHLDPDIRSEIRMKPPIDWRPAFGQVGAAQGLLHNAGVEKGDLFLFFGWFRRAALYNNEYKFSRGENLNVIYGYMQIGDIITEPQDIKKYYWHPHAQSSLINSKNNTLYIPAERLNFMPDKPGYGILNFSEDRVLTKENESRSTWKAYEFLLPGHIYENRKNTGKPGSLCYRGIWQELVANESRALNEWVETILS